MKPDAETQAALDKALRDKEEEENYKENESAHFQLKYNGAAQPALAREVLHVLETHYVDDRVRAELYAAGTDWRGAVHAAGIF